MADIKWIKIVTDMFDNRKIRQIECLPDGDSIIVIWMKLLCLAGQTNDNGMVYFTKDRHLNSSEWWNWLTTSFTYPTGKNIKILMVWRKSENRTGCESKGKGKDRSFLLICHRTVT